MNDSAASNPLTRKKIIAAISLLVVASAIYTLLMNTTSELNTTIKEPTRVAVRSLSITPTTLELSVSSEGNVQPRAETRLVSQVPGEVVEVSENLRSGAEFRKGQTLLKLDPRDFQINLNRARAIKDRAEAELIFATSEAERIKVLYGEELASTAELQQAERALSVATAASAEALSSVAQAEVDLERTTIVAPFNGRVRSESVDIGQFLQKGANIATVYDTERLEVRLPLADAQLAFLDASYTNTGVADQNPAAVTLSALYAGELQTWNAVLVRTEGDISIRSRFLYVIAEVSETINSNGVRLPVGLFVNAAINGRSVDNLVAIPRSAIRSDNTVMVIDENEQLRFRDVTLFKLSANEALISSGLVEGERISTSPLQFVVEGMPVQIVD